MKNTTRVAHVRRRFACAFVLISLLSVVVTDACAQLSVGDSGVPSYSQGISVPPGVGGMAPKLALLYAGGGVNGPLGHGWSVQGLSMVTRCPSTVAIDGKPGNVTYTASDKLCLDGQRLIQADASGNPLSFPQANDAIGKASGAYTEYRTEKDIYARVRAYGYANSDNTGASGPAYFRVWTKSGQIYDYGTNPSVNPGANALIAASGKPPMAWAVARISDTLGNFIDFKYEQRDVAWGSGPTAGSPTLGHEWNILEIQYSGNKVLFNYDDARTDKAEAYQLGNKNVSVRRLNSITTYVNSPATALGANGGTAVKTTQLTYETGTVSRRSRINKIQECAGAPGSSRCMPASTLQYANGGNEAYQASSSFAVSPLASLDMLGAGGTTGVLAGDFNGDGKTDLIYWADNPANNKLYTSNGDGNFTLQTGFNVADVNLFKSDGCYYSIAADFNGDGIPDILRVMRANATNGTNASCGTQTNLLLLANSDGSGGFTRITLPSTIALSQQVSTQQTVRTGPSTYGTTRNSGTNFYLLDINGDGFLDIVTTLYPGYPPGAYPTDDATLCANIGVPCTKVYFGSANGTFTQQTTNIANRSVYADPPAYWTMPRATVADFDGDGLSDLLAENGVWASLGDGNFVLRSSSSYGNSCTSKPIDFNGDGRLDCLYTSDAASQQYLVVASGQSNLTSVKAAGFNLNQAGQELGSSSPGNSAPSSGSFVADFNGDGQQDILRWKNDASQNVIYLSNGDGSFTQSTTFNLAGTQLQNNSGTASILLGDFTGRGAVELLRLQTVSGTATNVLYTKVDPTPADQLVSVTGGSGLTTTLYYVPLSNSNPNNGVSANLNARYQSDRGNSSYAVPNAVELTMPMYVVATSVSDSGVGTNKLATEMSYRGLKVDRTGRGLLGFREVLRQRSGAEGSPLTVDTQYLQIHPYTGVASSTSTYQSVLSAINAGNLLSTTTNVYCDQTNVAAASTSANCPVTAKIAKPYLYWSNESGKDLGGNALPTTTTTNVFNGVGDPTQITVTTTGTVAGVAQTFSKVTNNTFQADNMACSDVLTCAWVLGRLSQASVTNTVPNSIGAIPRSAGNNPQASSTAGSGP